MKLDNVIQPGEATHMPNTVGPTGIGGKDQGFSTDADNAMYNSLYDKVMADEKSRRESQGLRAEGPGFWSKLKSKLKWNRKKGNDSDVIR